MFNTYVVILWLFLLGGLAVTAWGWSIMAAARQTLRWPQVDGVVERSDISSNEDDLLPLIAFNYVVNGQQLIGKVEFPSGTMPTPELTASYVERYPLGSRVRVFYNPANIQQSTLTPGMGQGDWMIFVLGIIATIVAVMSLVMSA